MSIAQVFTELQGVIAQVNSIVASAYRVDLTGQFFFTATEQGVLVDSAVLRLFVGWETFLEETFVSYMTGNPSVAGNVLTRYVSPLDQNHARRMAVGSRRWVDWSTPDTVRTLAGLFFEDGEPYETVFAQISGELQDLKTVRNAAAHLASSTSAALDALATRRLNRPTVGTTAAKYVQAADPQSATGQSMLQTYEGMLGTAAHLIANA